MKFKIIKFSIIFFSFFFLITAFNFADAKQCFLNNECAEDEFCFQQLQKDCKADWTSCSEAESSEGICTKKLPPGSDCVKYYGDTEKGYCQNSFLSAFKAYGPQYCTCLAYSKVGEACGNPPGGIVAGCKQEAECGQGLFCVKQNGCGVCVGPSPAVEEKIKFTPIAPTLEIKIPTLQPFTTEGLTKPDELGNIYIPFIGEYIVAIYKWLLLVAGIIATIMIILGGFTYLTSGGNATQAGQGKERIGAAIFGLILLLGSYMLLYLINPGLVEFRSLKIKVIEREDITMPPENESITPGSFDFASAGITKPTWDENTFDCNKKSTYPILGVIPKPALATYTCLGIEGNITTIKEMQIPLCKAGALAESQGLTLVIPGGGWRSFEQQVENWCVSGAKNYEDVKIRKGFNAVPGFSNHGTGRAVDAYLKQGSKELTKKGSKNQCQDNDPAWVKKIADIFYAADPNFNRLESEIWHFEYGTSASDGTRGKYTGMPKKCSQ